MRKKLKHKNAPNCLARVAKSTHAYYTYVCIGMYVRRMRCTLIMMCIAKSPPLNRRRSRRCSPLSFHPFLPSVGSPGAPCRAVVVFKKRNLKKKKCFFFSVRPPQRVCPIYPQRVAARDFFSSPLRYSLIIYSHSRARSN